jgi:hypothetical protein
MRSFINGAYVHVHNEPYPSPKYVILYVCKYVCRYVCKEKVCLESLPNR